MIGFKNSSSILASAYPMVTQDMRTPSRTCTHTHTTTTTNNNNNNIIALKKWSKIWSKHSCRTVEKKRNSKKRNMHNIFAPPPFSSPSIYIPLPEFFFPESTPIIVYNDWICAQFKRYDTIADVFESCKIWTFWAYVTQDLDLTAQFSGLLRQARGYSNSELHEIFPSKKSNSSSVCLFSLKFSFSFFLGGNYVHPTSYAIYTYTTCTCTCIINNNILQVESRIYIG